MKARTARLSRETLETKVGVSLNLDGRGRFSGSTGLGMLDHLLAQLARHGLLDLEVTARGDPSGPHHLVEDLAITLGRALRQALGEGQGIRRFGQALVPLDEALASVALDLGGRGYAVVEPDLVPSPAGDLPGDLVRHFLESFALEARITLHASVPRGLNPHHRAEAVFKALALALREAVRPEPRLEGEPPSTKGTVTG